eukprot:EG_transcript_6778
MGPPGVPAPLWLWAWLILSLGGGAGGSITQYTSDRCHTNRAINLNWNGSAVLQSAQTLTSNWIQSPGYNLYLFGQDVSFSVELWLFIGAFPGSQSAIILSNKGTGNSGLQVSLLSNQSLQWNVGDTTRSVVLAAAGLPLGRWHHVAATFARSGNASLFVNGTLVQSADMSFVGNINTGNPLVVGNTGTKANPTPFVGAIDELRLWRESRPPQLVRALMFVSLTGQEANLITYYPFADLSIDSTGAQSTTPDLGPADCPAQLSSDMTVAQAWGEGPAGVLLNCTATPTPTDTASLTGTGSRTLTRSQTPTDTATPTSVLTATHSPTVTDTTSRTSTDSGTVTITLTPGPDCSSRGPCNGHGCSLGNICTCYSDPDEGYWMDSAAGKCTTCQAGWTGANCTLVDGGFVLVLEPELLTFDAAAQLRTQQALTDVLALPAAALGLLGVAVTTGPPANRRAIGTLQNLTVIQHVTLQAHYRVVPVGAYREQLLALLQLTPSPLAALHVRRMGFLAADGSGAVTWYNTTGTSRSGPCLAQGTAIPAPAVGAIIGLTVVLFVALVLLATAACCWLWPQRRGSKVEPDRGQGALQLVGPLAAPPCHPHVIAFPTTPEQRRRRSLLSNPPN